MTEFTELMGGLWPNSAGGWAVDVSDDWLQGRTVYGGLAAALCLEAAQRASADLPTLRSAQFSFVGPAAGPLQIRPSVLRKGKSTVFVGVDLVGEAGLATRATLCFGAARPSTLSYSMIVAPRPKAPDDCQNFFRNAPASLRFLQHIDGRLAGGHLPFSGAADADTTLWLRHRDPALRPSLTSLLALADAPPPAVMALLDAPAPISTMTWAIDMLAEEIATDQGWWLVRAVAEAAAGGYSSQAMTVWNAAGTPVMASRQNVAVFT
jgi:acyl-CoA thioesterase